MPFGISLSGELVQQFDRLIQRKKYTTRSKAIAALTRQELVPEEWRQGGEITGACVNRRNPADFLPV